MYVFITQDSPNDCRLFRATGDNHRFLWFSKKGSISVVESKTYHNLEYESFWNTTKERKALTPQFAVSSPDCSKIFAVGVADSTTFLIFQNFKSPRVFKQIKKSSEQSQMTYICGDNSTEADIVFAAGIVSAQPSIMALSFDKKLETVASWNLPDKEARLVSRLKRIEGSNYLMAGMNKSVGIVRYNPEEKTFITVHQIPVNCKGRVSSLVFDTDKIYALTSPDSKPLVVEFSSAVDQKELWAAERSSPSGDPNSFVPFSQLEINLEKTNADEEDEVEDSPMVVPVESLGYDVVELFLKIDFGRGRSTSSKVPKG